MVDAPFAVDGTVSAEKLDELLAAGTEYAELDFKRELDLARGQDKHRCDFASDVAALSTLPRGGYIVVGVDGDGKVAADEHPEPNPEQYDEAKLRQIVASYVEGEIRLAVRLHRLDGRSVALVYVGPSGDDLPPVMRRDGTYGRKDGSVTTVFRAGDVFVRVGTSSRRMRHVDWPRLLANFRARVRAEVALDTQDVMGRLAEMLRTSNAPAVVDVALAPAAFEQAVDAALTGGDVGAIRRALLQTGPARSRWADTDKAEEIEIALDRMVATAAVAVQHENHEVFDIAVTAMYDLYTAALESPRSMIVRNGRERQAAWLWRATAARVLALLALIVRLRAWTFVSKLVLRPIGPGGEQYTYHSWLRHAVTEASGRNLLTHRDGEPAEGALVSFARDAARRVPALRTDVAEEDVEREPLLPLNGESDDLLDSLCQADFLWCLVVVTDRLRTDRKASHEFYPSCAGFFAVRTQPIADRLVSEQRVISTLFGSNSDHVIAEAITYIDETAGRLQPRYRWTIRNDVVKGWIAKNTL